MSYRTRADHAVGRECPPVADGGERARTDGHRVGTGVVILNPVSGSGEHGEQVRDLAAEYGFTVRETEAEGDGVDLARAAIREDVDTLLAAGGDGTVNEVVRGLHAADALDGPLLGVVPAGTGNNFAGNIGIEGIEHAFEVATGGEVRDLDVALANDRPFINSCVGGLTAEASSETTTEAKDSLGVFAYVIETFRQLNDYEGHRLHIETAGEADSWSGDAVSVLIGNGRCFPIEGATQGDIEDGLMDVTVIEERPTAHLVGEATLQRLFDSDTENIDRFRTQRLDIDVLSDEPVTFSLDGEMLSSTDLAVTVRPGVLSLAVGDAYDPDPGEANARPDGE